MSSTAYANILGAVKKHIQNNPLECVRKILNYNTSSNNCWYRVKKLSMNAWDEYFQVIAQHVELQDHQTNIFSSIPTALTKSINDNAKNSNTWE